MKNFQQIYKKQQIIPVYYFVLYMKVSIIMNYFKAANHRQQILSSYTL